MTDLPAMTATRETGLSALENFVPAAGRQYARSRNFDYGPERRDNVSVLSPFVRHRLVLEEDLLRAVIEQHSFNDAQKFIEEVYWRTYFKGWLEHHPDVWMNYRADLATQVAELESNSEKRERYNQAVAGQSGIDCFDAWTRELAETGYLHNHARMWFASIWVYTLELPWQLGADFFLRHLLDGDPASNTLGWRWVCGLHTRGKTYLARVSNILNYTDNRFNPQGRLATQAIPLTEEIDYPQEALRFGSAELPEQPYALLLTEEDCNAESLHTALSPAAVLGAIGVRRRSLLPVGQRAHAFAKGAVEDGVARATESFGCAGETFEADDWSEHLVDRCREAGVETLVTAFVPTGPVNDILASSRAALDEAGIRLVMMSRQYDRETWPFASRGYFKLKKQIGSVIERMHLDTIELPAELQVTDAAPRQQDLLRSSG